MAVLSGVAKGVAKLRSVVAKGVAKLRSVVAMATPGHPLATARAGTFVRVFEEHATSTVSFPCSFDSRLARRRR